MTSAQTDDIREPKFLATLERLLAIEATAVKPALEEASTLIAAAVDADKADTFLHEPSNQTLIAVGTSDTPMGRHQRSLGLDRLPIANGGRAVEVFRTGRLHQDGRVDADPEELRGMREALGIRSSIIVPLDVAGVRRGAVLISSARPDAFSSRERIFIEAVARWVGLVIQRAELVERLTREATEQARRLVAEELLAVLAHDLSNYLAAVVARVYLLRVGAEREGRTRDIEEINTLERALRRLERFIADLLDVSRLDEGVFALRRHAVNLADLVRDVAAAAQGPQLALTVRAAEDVVATVDPNRIRQALENLLVNAQRHASGSAVLLEVQRESRADGEYAVVSVADHGPGIPPELLPRLAERFVRGAGSAGLGIGLYLARSIAEAHGGRLEVVSALGKGTTFRLVVPLEHDAGAREPALDDNA